VSRLADKVALVTGAGRGIGAAIAEAFVREGAAVALAERDAASGEALARHLRERYGARAIAVTTDVREAAALEHAVQVTRAAWGPVDVLVNNAGINVFKDPLAMSEDEWRACFAVDLDGVWHGCRAVLPGMLAAGRGSIVNIASTHGFKIIPGCFPYPVAKHGVIGLTRALGIEYAARGVRVNAIAPGYIETALLRQWWDAQPDPAAARETTCARIPSGRVGRPEEVAMTAVFLASDEAPFINASCITIDGGRSELYHE
jgi:NAD(P)-dependent dehydrogenase (short-subunit alcohol dehydrogenase family)